MFIDYLTLLLLNMTAGFAVLAFFLLRGLDGDRRRWATPFAMVGLVALISGIYLIFTWPLPGAYNSAFGETTVLLGILYLGIALSLAKEWNPAPIAIYGILAALVAILIGVRIAVLHDNPGIATAKPMLSSAGFILSGLGGVLAALAFCVPTSKTLRATGALALLLAALIWAVTAYLSYWMHMEYFSTYKMPPKVTAPAPSKPAEKPTGQAPSQ